jgi:hypothetical protein
LNILNPEAIVLAGRVFDAGDCVFDAVCRSAAWHAPKPERARVLRSALGENAVIAGAVLLAANQASRDRIPTWLPPPAFGALAGPGSK